MRRALLAAGVLGAATVLAFAPFELFFVPMLTLAALFALWRQGSPARAAALGFAWGLGCFLTGVSWVYVSLHEFGGMAAPLAVLATLLLCAYLALYPALAGYLTCRLASADARAWALCAAGVWALSEWLRGTLLTGFPWLAIGTSQTPPSPLAGYVPVLGSQGLNFLVALIAASLAVAWRRPATWALLVGLVAGGALLRGMDWTQPSGAPLRVALLQGNVPQSLKWSPERLSLSIDTYLELARQAPAPLVVLPETALPLFFDEVPHEVLSALTQHGEALLGIAIRHREGGYVNGAVALTPTAPAATTAALPPLARQSYAKRHLVPFGEYAPPGFAWFFRYVQIPMSDFTAGPPLQPPLTLAGQRIAVNICYEDVFAAEIRAALPQATLLVNLSNTAWFGDSLAQPQHLQIARLRALESGRMMLRATNTGITAAIAPDGAIVAQLPPFTRAALLVSAQGYQGVTPYVRWGDALALVLALAALVPALRAATRRRSR